MTTVSTTAKSVPTTANDTRSRIADEALLSFAGRGYEATALDALAAKLGIRKQTILHHFGSKELLLEAVLQRTVGEYALSIDAALGRAGTPWARLDAVVRAVFALTGQRPHTLALLREVGRLGPAWVVRLNEALDPLSQRATEFVRSAMSPSRGPRDPRLVVLSAYASVIAAVTEVEVLRSLGVEPSARLAVRRRRELLAYLAEMLGVAEPSTE